MLRAIDVLLCQIPSRSAPPGFLDGVMAAVEGRKTGSAGAINKAKTSRSRRKWSSSLGGWETIRDLALAAAVTLVVFWNGGSWFDNQHIMKAGDKLDLAFRSYVQYSGNALDKACTNIENLNGTLMKER